MTPEKLASWFCTAVVNATVAKDTEEQVRLAEALAKAFKPLTENESMDLYGMLFYIPVCHSAKLERDIGNGNSQMDRALNYVTAKETLER
jgi:hypothetical protein